ncbi:MAG: HAMP domain-containing protein [Solirubrobacteraceae bacterium]|nr:HAMP domain-containing protein [Solirubrobacteraceae bacterium]
MLAIIALEVPLAVSTADRVDAEIRSQARGQADVVASSASELVKPPDRAGLDTLVTSAARSVRGRVIVVNARGRLLADSGGSPRGTNYADRPEIARALRGDADQRERHSDTLDQSLLATAVPVVEEAETVGAVRITQSMAAVDRAVRRAWIGLAGVGVIVLLIGLAVGALIAGQIARPVVRLEDTARRVGDGDLGARAPVEGSAEQRTLARTFNDMTARVQRLIASQREFVADASHQLRTPLTGLRLRLEEARAESADPQVQEDLDAALGEVDRLAVMVAELLELSRAGERDAPAETLLLGEVAEHAAERWAAEAATRGQRVAADVDEAADAEAFVPRADIDRVLDVLVENALHYAPPATTVTIAARPGELTVRDAGPGLATDESELVFERFHRGSAARGGPGGTGLGLPIARELASRWGGEVRLANAPGGGALARVSLPPQH